MSRLILVAIVAALLGCSAYGPRYHGKLLFQPYQSQHLRLQQRVDQASIEFAGDATHGEFVGFVHGKSHRQAQIVAGRIGAAHIVEVGRSSGREARAILPLGNGVAVPISKTVYRLTFAAYRD